MRGINRNFLKNFEKEHAKFIRKNVYYWYLQEKGTHEKKLAGLWRTLKKLILPPMTDELKDAIIAYVETRNELFEKSIINALTDDITEKSV